MIARCWHALTAVVALAAVVLETSLVASGHYALVSDDLPAVHTRIIRLLSYFTIESNLLVVISTALLARRHDQSRLSRILRLDGLFGITITFIVYSVLLAPIHSPHGSAAISNAGLHYVVPIMAVLGWLVFGPRPRIDDTVMLLSLIWPAAYIVYTLAHGAASDWYPYPFIDVADLGYVTALRNGLLMVVLMAGVAWVFRYGDTRLPTWFGTGDAGGSAAPKRDESA
jgi:hypothetical protein